MPTTHRLVIEAAIRHLREGVERIDRCLGMVDDDFVWTDPGESLVSIGNLVQHLCGNVSQWVLQGLAVQPFERDRDAEFATKGGEPGAELSSWLGDVVRRACDALEGLPEGALEKRYTIQGFDYDGVGALVHVVEHFSYHVGQITFAVKQTRGTGVGYYEGQDLDVP